jgi:hypothetical protein
MITLITFQEAWRAAATYSNSLVALMPVSPMTETTDDKPPISLASERARPGVSTESGLS